MGLDSIAQSAPAHSILPRPGVSTRSRFHLYQRNVVLGGVGYGLDGSFVVQRNEVVVTIDGGSVFAKGEVVLHSLRIGICGLSEEGYAYNAYSPEIALGDIRLAPGEGYKLPRHVARIQLRKAPPQQNWLCGTLSESNGNDAVEDLEHHAVVPPASGVHRATDFWKNKDPDKWSSEERQSFLKESPWAHSVLIQVPSDVMRYGHPISVGTITVVIRWESAKLLRHALKDVESKEYNDTLANLSKDYYVISVVKVEPRTGESNETAGEWSPELLENLRQVEQSRWNAQTVTLRRANESILQTGMMSGDISQGRIDLFLFPRALALEAGDGILEFDVSFPAGMGRVSFPVKFNLRALRKVLIEACSLWTLAQRGWEILRDSSKGELTGEAASFDVAALAETGLQAVRTEPPNQLH